MLDLLHEGHFNASKMKSCARSLMFWPGIDKEIEALCAACIPCCANRQNPTKVELTPWPVEEEPWKRVHVDVCGPIKGKHLLILIDSCTKWLEGHILKNLSTEETMEKLRLIFSTHGLCRTLVSDNGTNFTSSKFEDFLEKNGITHVTSPPRHQQSNGLAENAVKSVKNKIKTYMMENGQQALLNTLIARFLLCYRTTPHTTTRRTPAEMLLEREVRTRLSMIKDKPGEAIAAETFQQMQTAQDRQKKNFRGIKRDLKVGQRVMVAD